MDHRFRKAAVLCVLLFSFSCAAEGGGPEPATRPKAKNIILFIGDGMGAEHRKAARWSIADEEGKLFMDTMPAEGMLTTHSADDAVTDSAAAATALAAGVKTNKGVLSLDANSNRVATILEEAQAQGMAVGLVTTTEVTHATPAAFAAHIEDRTLMTEIARQILETAPDVLLGGGENEFLPVAATGCFPEPGKRADGRNLLQDAAALGYTVVCGRDAFIRVTPSSTARLIGLFSDQAMLRPFSPSLAEMTRKAIDMLSGHPRGFFLMVEAGQLDWASHTNDAAQAIQDTLDLDEAVGVARQFALQEADTLIIVTADHETGGMTVSRQSSGLNGEDGPFRTPAGTTFYVNWATTEHTAVNVPVTSQGPLAERLTGTNDNTSVYDVMISALRGL